MVNIIKRQTNHLCENKAFPTSTNSNVLDGLKCPECGSLGPYSILASCFATVTDDGIEETKEFSWQESAYCRCHSCDYQGTVDDFNNGLEAQNSDQPAAGICGKCDNCLALDKVRQRVLACCNPPFSHADDDVVDVWNDSLKRYPCTHGKEKL